MQRRSLSSWTIAMINVAAICNIKNFPLMAEYGLSTLFFLVLASAFYFIPVSLVSAELATGWPDRGVYTWVKEGLSPKFGFLAVWLQWIENVIWYPTILSFIATTFAYAFMPELAQNRFYVVFSVLISFWGATLINFLGMRTSGWISNLSAIFGTIVPIVLIVVLGGIWMLKDPILQIRFEIEALFPKLTSLHELSLLSGFVMSFAGMEMSAVHARDAINPRKDYPKAIFLSASIIISLSAIGSIVIAAVVPLQEIELTSGGIAAFRYLFQALSIPWALPFIAGIMTLGSLGALSTWIVGPSRSLLATALDGDLPPILQKRNRHSMPVAIMVAQGIIVSFLSLVFLTMPSVSSSYWILLALASSLYMVMYVLMFLAAIRLRRIHPETPRTYRVPGGTVGLWVVSGLGICSSSFSVMISLFPPSQIETGSSFLYESILVGGIFLFCSVPFLIYRARKPEWSLQKPPGRQ